MSIYLNHLSDKELVESVGSGIHPALRTPLVQELAKRLADKTFQKEREDRRFGQPHYGHGERDE